MQRRWLRARRNLALLEKHVIGVLQLLEGEACLLWGEISGVGMQGFAFAAKSLPQRFRISPGDNAKPLVVTFRHARRPVLQPK